MDTVLGIPITEHTGKTRHRTADGHGSVTAPHNIFSLLAKTSFLRTGVSLIPHRSSSPDPACPLECIGNRGILSPVNKQADWCTDFTGFPHIVEPLCHPVGPGTLVLVIPIKIRQCILCLHTAIFLIGGTVSFILLCSPGRIRRIGNHCIKDSRLECFHQLQRISM